MRTGLILFFILLILAGITALVIMIYSKYNQNVKLSHLTDSPAPLYIPIGQNFAIQPETKEIGYMLSDQMVRVLVAEPADSLSSNDKYIAGCAGGMYFLIDKSKGQNGLILEHGSRSDLLEKETTILTGGKLNTSNPRILPGLNLK